MSKIKSFLENNQQYVDHDSMESVLVYGEIAVRELGIYDGFAVTSVSDDELATLKNIDAFNEHVAAGHLEIIDDEDKPRRGRKPASDAVFSEDSEV